MSSGVATKSLLKNVWFLAGNGFKYGYVFMHGSRIEDAREGEPEPEYELAELVYDFEGDAVVVHGYSLLVDLVEYVVRGVNDLDLSVFTREELRKLTKVGVVNAYMSGVTLPVAHTRHPEIAVDVARENSVRIGIIAERGTVPSRGPFTLLLEVDGSWLYYDDRRLGEYDSLVCKPGNIKGSCVLVDARGYGNITTAIEEVYREVGNPEASYKILTDLYRVSGADSGFVEKGALSDIIVYDLKNSLKAIPIKTTRHMFTLLSRSQQPDIVFIGGDVFYEFGENLAIPIVKVNEILKKATSRDLDSG
ncbi:MAG: hypothetical protein QW700_00135 [Desulfurococcaceae archaeon]